MDIYMNVHMYAYVNLCKHVHIPIPIPCFFHIDSGRYMDILLHPVHTTEPGVLLVKFSLLVLKGVKEICC